MNQAVTKPEFPKIDKETERRAQAIFWELPEDATWAQIRTRVYEKNDPIAEPYAWEMTMKSLFGSDLFDERPILRIY